MTTLLLAPRQVAGGDRSTCNYPQEHLVPAAGRMKASLTAHEEVNPPDSQEGARQVTVPRAKGRGRTGYCCTQGKFQEALL